MKICTAEILFALASMIFCCETALAEVIADAGQPDSRQPVVINTAEGTPLVNIQAPDDRGLSHNSYSQFDVDSKGVILNNSSLSSKTQLAGEIEGNPHLAAAGATVILNEINSTQPSQLAGLIEVAGGTADVVIANPAGITCDDCGFINADKIVMTTGMAQWAEGELNGFNIEGGGVAIQGAGMDSSRQDFTHIIARSVKINAGIWARHLKVIGGLEPGQTTTRSVGARHEDQGDEPQFAIDVRYLGGMYAYKILLVGNEDGVGVHNAGDIGSDNSSVEISANGHIDNAGNILGKDVTLKSSRDFNNRGALAASALVDIHIKGSLRNQGLITARDYLKIRAADVDSASGGTMAAGMPPEGNPDERGNLSVKAEVKLTAQGQIMAANQLQLSAPEVDVTGGELKAKNLMLHTTQGNLTAARAHINAQNGLKLKSRLAIISDGGRIEGDKVNINARRLSNQGGAITQSGASALQLKLAESLNNQGGVIANHGSDLSIDCHHLDNRQGKILHHGDGSMRISAHRLQGNGGMLNTGGHFIAEGGEIILDGGHTSARRITVKANDLSNCGGTLVQGDDATLKLTLLQSLVNRGGRVESNGGVRLEAGALDNVNGKIISAPHAAINVQSRGNFINHNGQLNAGKSLRLQGGDIDNRHGTLFSAGDAAVSSWQAVDNQYGRLESRDALTLTSAGINNAGGEIMGGGLKLTLPEHPFSNTQGTISGNDVSILSGELNNDQGKIYAANHLQLNTSGALLINRHSKLQGGIIGAKSLLLECGGFENKQGILDGGGDASIKAEDIYNNQGVITSSGPMLLVSKTLDNTEGLIENTDIMTIHTQGNKLVNAHAGDYDGIFSYGPLTVLCGELYNPMGIILSGKVARAPQQNPPFILESSLAEEGGSGDLLIDCKMLNNNGGSLQAEGRVKISLLDGELSNRDSGPGKGIIAKGALKITSGYLDNQGGVLKGAIDAILQVGQVNNKYGNIQSAHGALDITSLSLDNSWGLIQALELLSINTQGNRLNNYGGDPLQGIFSAGSMKLRTGTLDNQAGQIKSNKMMQLWSGDIINNGGHIIGQGDIQMLTRMMNNNGGLLRSHASLYLDTDGQLLINRGKHDGYGISSEGPMKLIAGAVDNVTGDIRCNGNLLLTCSHLSNQGGAISSLKDVDLTSGVVANVEGMIKARQSLWLNTLEPGVDNSGGILGANSALGITGGALANRGGRIESAGELSIDTQGQSLDNQGGIMLGASGIDVNAGTIVNGQGHIQALGPVTLNALKTLFNNAFGFIHSEAAVNLNAKNIDNNQNQTLAGRSVSIKTEILDNAQGKIFAKDQLNIISQRSLDNSGGQLACEGRLRISDGKQGHQLRIANRGGGLMAHRELDVAALAFAGNGNIHSLGNLTLRLPNGQFINKGHISAGGNLVFDVNKHLINHTHILAGGTATLTTDRLDNQRDATIHAAGNSLRIQTRKNIDNHGLIDGEATDINADILNCSGGGRIYGSHLALHLNQLNNLSQSCHTAVIAAREHLAIGAKIINNQKNNLIYSAGSMAVGGGFDAGLQVMGMAAKLVNKGIVEAAGDMTLASEEIENANPYLVIGERCVYRLRRHEAALKGAETRYDWPQVKISAPNISGIHRARMPDGRAGHEFNEYDYERVIRDNTIIKSLPGQILAGGDLRISSRSLQNSDSQILAGGALDVQAQPLDNRATSGMRNIKDYGTMRQWYAKIEKLARRAGGSAQGIKESQYRPAETNQEIALQTPIYLNRRRSAPAGSGDGISGAGPVVASISYDLTLPEHQLFALNKDDTERCLLTIDPAYRRQKVFLSSLYMLENGAPHPGSAVKFFGDGAVEQRLVRQQVIDLTRKRYLPGFTSDEAQYKSLMDAGIAFGRHNNLIPGVAPTAAQMAQMASQAVNMVWLEKQDVIMPDGSVQRVLAPRLYTLEVADDMAGSSVLMGDRHRAYAGQTPYPPLPGPAPGE